MSDRRKPTPAGAGFDHRALVAEVKLKRVLAVTGQLLRSGEVPNMSEIARRSGVSRKFLYRPDVREAISEAIAAAPTAPREHRGGTKLTELEAYRIENSALRAQVAELQTRLASGGSENPAWGEADALQSIEERLADLEARLS